MGEIFTFVLLYDSMCFLSTFLFLSSLFFLSTIQHFMTVVNRAAVVGPLFFLFFFCRKQMEFMNGTVP